MRYLIAILALAGSINEKWDCGIVNHSQFAEIEHVPVAAIGIAGYLLLAGLALARKRMMLALLALGALGYSLYLTRIEKSVLGVWCLYCVISLGIITLVTVLSLSWWALSGRPRLQRV